MNVSNFGREKLSACRAVSLVELLIVLVIILILAGIAIVGYQGSLDNSELKIVLPHLQKELLGLQAEAEKKSATIVTDFEKGTTMMHIAVTANGRTETRDFDLKERFLLKRPLIFLEAEWPDGSTTPRTFTFFPSANTQGPKMQFGTGHAMVEFSPSGKGQIHYDYK